MPDYHGEGGATVKTEHYAKLIAERNRQREADKHHRATRPRPIPTPVTVPETTTEAPAKPKHKARRSRRHSDNPTRPRKRDKQGASRLRRQLHGALMYWHDAERAMVRDAEAAERREKMDAEYGAGRCRCRVGKPCKSCR